MVSFMSRLVSKHRVNISTFMVDMSAIFTASTMQLCRKTKHCLTFLLLPSYMHLGRS